MIIDPMFLLSSYKINTFYYDNIQDISIVFNLFHIFVSILEIIPKILL
jgi:hypothetical protein